MQEYKNNFLLIAIFALSSLALFSCKKEKVHVYDVDNVNVTQPGAVKPNVKTDQEVISISYSDLFGATIAQNKLEDLSAAYSAFGDKRLMIDMIILNFLNDPLADIPTPAEMRADVGTFTTETFKKFLVREPNEFEKWYVINRIDEDQSITPELVYYAFMTSNEYRFY